MSSFSSKLAFSVFLVVMGSASWNTAAAQGRQTGEIRGAVSDQTGAFVQGVKVTITNAATGVNLTATSDPAGVYDIPFVQPGQYSITFAKSGFRTLVRSGITMYLETITVNATLEVGAVVEKVLVTADAPLVQTESSERNTTLTADMVSSAPSIDRNWMDLFAAVPGVNPGGGEESTGQGIAVNGQQPFFSNWQIDGGIAMLGQSSNPDALEPPIETIQEVSLTTANFGAEYGNGLSVFNVITKSGTNNFHGSAYEYIENDAANAENRFAQPPPFNKPMVRWNEFGFNLGGPIKKSKAFFFVSFERNPFHSAAPTYESYPTTGLQPNGGQGYIQGDFSMLLGTPTGTTNPCDPSQVVLNGQIYDPLTTQTVSWQGNQVVCRLPFPGNIIPSNRWDPVAAKIQKYFLAPNLSGAGNVNNYYALVPSDSTQQWINGKLDYDITPRNRITGSFMVVNFDSPYDDPICDINCSHWGGNEPQGQITDVWTLTPNLVNEFRFSLSREHGVGTDVNQGQGWPAKLGLANPAGNLFPNIWINGSLNTGIGNPAQPPAIDAETTFIYSDAATWVRGKHILKFGGEFDRWWVNTGWGTAQEGGFWWGGALTQNPYDQTLANVPSEGEGYADFLLGLPESWWISINPETGGRMWSAQSFAQDEYKVKPNLTLTLGLRYVIQSGWSEVQNEISGFQPSISNPAGGPLGAMWYGGQDGHRAMTDTIWDFFAPRVGVAWSPRKDWSVRGGVGLYNIIAGQNTIAPAQAWGQGWVPVGSMQCYPNAQGLETPVFQLGNLNPPNWPSQLFPNCYAPQPFGIGPPLPIYPTSQNRTPDLFNGQNVNYTPWKIPMEYYVEYQFDIQHEFARGVVLDIGYVGNRGVNLQLGRDINQIPLSGPNAGTRPNPNYAQINASLFDGHSNYNALHVIANKRLAQGLSFGVNYAWSKVLDMQTGAGWGGAGASERFGQNYQNAYDMNSNYGPAVNDIRQTFNGSVDYEMPFGRGKQFLNHGGVANGIVGGWQLSSIFFVRSGVPTTVVMGEADGAGSGQWRPNQVGDPWSGTCPNGDHVKTLHCWFNTSAFATPSAGTFGDVGRDTIYGPHWVDVDLALLKNFPLKSVLGENGNLQFKLCATDVFNHPNLGLPDTTYTDAGFGGIWYANTSRKMQLGAKISF
jgi:hypothetical protein